MIQEPNGEAARGKRKRAGVQECKVINAEASLLARGWGHDAAEQTSPTDLGFVAQTQRWSKCPQWCGPGECSHVHSAARLFVRAVVVRFDLARKLLAVIDLIRECMEKGGLAGWPCPGAALIGKRKLRQPAHQDVCTSYSVPHECLSDGSGRGSGGVCPKGTDA